MQGHAFKENIGTRTNINNRGGGGGSRCLVYMCLLSLDFPAEQCSNPKHHICMFVRPHLWRTEMRKLGALAMPLVRSFSTPPPPPPGAHQITLLLIPKPIADPSLTCFFGYFVCSVLTVCIFLPSPLSHSGKPETYAEYFSLNRTTAELLLLKPVDRELHRRFDLVIKVGNTALQTEGKGLTWFSSQGVMETATPHPPSSMCTASFLFFFSTINPQWSIKLLISKPDA